MMLSLFGDAIVAVLLIATISYAAMLNGRLAVLRGDRAKFDELIQGLTAAAQRAESGIAGLKVAAEDVGRRLERKIEEGQSLRDDLSYMLERGSLIADRLEGTIRARRDGGKADLPPERKRDPKDPQPRLDPARPLRADLRIDAAAEDSGAPRGATPSRAERELLRALTGR